MELGMSFLSALACSLGGSLVNIMISWFVLFRHSAFREKIATIEKKRRTLDDLKMNEDDDDKQTAKKIKKLEAEIGVLTKDIATKNMQASLISSISLFVINRWCRSLFVAKVCARIPFTPFGFLTKITHGGIENEDMRDGNFQFVYWMGSMLFRDILTKLLGFQVPQMSGAPGQLGAFPGMPPMPK